MYQPFNRSTFISCEIAASEAPKLQSDLSFWYSAIISCGEPPKSHKKSISTPVCDTHDLRKGLRLWQLPIRIPPHLCASDAHDFLRVLRVPQGTVTFHHTFVRIVRPTSTISAEGSSGTKDFAFRRAFSVRPARSAEKVTFRNPPGCRCRLSFFKKMKDRSSNCVRIRRYKWLAWKWISV